jgi:hypothetical protein
VIDERTANIMYQETIRDLKMGILAHKLPNGEEASIRSFCLQYGIARSNLFDCFAGRGDLGVGLYMKIAGILGLLGTEYIVMKNLPIHNISLRWFLMLDSSAIKDSMIKLRFDTHLTPEV